MLQILHDNTEINEKEFEMTIVLLKEWFGHEILFDQFYYTNLNI